MDLNICNTEDISNDRDRNILLLQKNTFQWRIWNFVAVTLNMKECYRDYIQIS